MSLLIIFFSILNAIAFAYILFSLNSSVKKINVIYFTTLAIFFFLTQQIILSFILLQTSSFKNHNILIINTIIFLILCFFVAFFNKKIRLRKINFIISKFDLVFLLFVGIMILVLLPNISEWNVSSGMDAGNYVNIAQRFASSGAFNEEVGYELTFGQCLSGFRCSEGVFAPLYLHTFPIILSWGILLFGEFGINTILAFFIFASMLSFYSLINRYFNSRKLALIGVSILALNPIQIIYYKEIMSEILAQSLFFIALIFFYEYLRQKKYIYGYLLTMSLSLIFLTKLDSLLIILIFTVFLGFSIFLKNKPPHLPFISIPFVFVNMYYWFFAKWYTSVNSPGAADLGIPLANILLTIPILVSIAVKFVDFSKIKFINQTSSFLIRYRKLIIYFFSLLALGFVIIRYFGVYPDFLTGLEHDKYNALRLTFFFTWLMVIFCIIGFFLFVNYEKRISYLLVVLAIGILAYYTILFSNHSSPLYWWSRRYLLFAVPLVVFFNTFFFKILFKFFKRKSNLIKVLPFLVLGITYIVYFYNSIYAFQIHQNEGINDDIIKFEKFLIQTEGDAMIYQASKIYHTDNKVFSSIDSRNNNIEVIRLKMDKNSEDMFSNELVHYENLVWVDPDQDITSFLSENGYRETNCSNHKFDYDTVYSTKLTCEYSILRCSWREMLSTLQRDDSLKVCSYKK